MRLTARQVEQLLRPIHEKRVLKDGKGHSHVSQQDTIAHLIRVFGFCNFDIDVLNAGVAFEEQRVNDSGKPTGRWDVCYRAMVRLTIKDPDGNELCHYEDGSTATAQNQTRGDAHDLAFKSSISLAVKRAAKDLGDQFGLSLYNKGQLSALVMATLVTPDPDADPAEDLQDGVEKQVSLGNDEIDREDGDA
ncbi:Rad52/Rad22 family DNA repair protein [Nocardia sp. Marseille-Q1738]